MAAPVYRMRCQKNLTLWCVSQKNRAHLPARTVAFRHARQLRHDALGRLRAGAYPAAESADGLDVAAGGDPQVFIFAPRPFRLEVQVQQIVVRPYVPWRQRVVGIEVEMRAAQRIQLTIEPQRVFMRAEIAGLQVETQVQACLLYTSDAADE